MVDRMTPEAMRAGRSANELQQNIGGLEQKSGSFLKRAGMWSAGAVAAITAAIAALGGAAASMAAEVDRATGKLQAQTGLTRQQAEELMKVSEAIYTSGRGDSITGITEDLATVRQSMKDLSDQAAGDFLAGGYVIRDAFNAEISETSKVVRTLQANFAELSATDALDLITTGFQLGGDYAGDFMDTINEYSVHFAGLGMSAEQMFATLIAGSREGSFNLDKVGDSVKESFIRMQDMSKGSQEAFQALGMDGQKMAADIAAGGDRANQAFQATLLALGNLDDSLKRNQTGVALFGTQWEDMEDRVILAMMEGQKGLGDFRGATQRAGDALYNNLGTKFSRLWRSITVELARAGGPIAGILNGLLDQVISHMPQISAAVQFVAQIIAKVLTALISAGQSVTNFLRPVAPFIGGIAIAFGAFAGVIGIAKGAVLAFNIAMQVMRVLMLTNPIGWVILVIGLLIGAFIKMNGGMDGAKAKLLEYWAITKQTWQNIWAVIGPTVMQILQKTLAAFSAIVNWVIANWPMIRDTVINTVRAIYVTVAPVVMNIVGSIVNGFMAVWNWVMTYWPMIQQVISFVWAGLGPYISTYVNFIVQTIVTAFNLIWSVANSVWNMIAGIVQVAWSIISGVIGIGLSILTGDWAQAWQGMLDMLTGIRDGISRFFEGLGTLLFDSGKAIITTLVEGIKAVGEAPVEAMKGIFEKVRQYLPFSDAKVGPLSDLTYSGSKIPGTIAEGVRQGAGQLRAATHSMMEGLGLDRAFSVRLAATGGGLAFSSGPIAEGSVSEAPAPGLRTRSNMNVRELFRESVSERETIREQAAGTPSIVLNYHGGTEKERRDLMDDLERLLKAHNRK
ncbi:phage tail tape measure protein [Paenibacillus tyrfis]|uniref:phage tail tape measure protein n=2 Tax=Paenibacillus tyrfis TaxID=1501230 RepID=UPI0015C5AB04|nr:phage tail tape measure protein [Paenibacillus tyrfis]